MTKNDWLKNCRTFLRYGAVIAIVIILTRCANESVPQGGKRDEIPPTAKKFTPEDKATRFKEDKISISFDEFIKAGAFSQTLISPPMDKRPDFIVAGKTLNIKLKSPLRDSTTYTINFADDIQDINEGNKAANFTYVFSTGDYIDSQKIVGNVLLAKDNSNASDIVVCLYPRDSSDGILKMKPFYFAKTNKSGHFEINNIKAGSYHIFGLKDQNYNYLYDQPNEMIAFSDTVLKLEDSIVKNVTLYLFDENKRSLKLDEIVSLAPGLLQISYTQAIKRFKLNGDLFSEGDLAWFYDTNDTIHYWYSKYYIKKTDLFLVANDTLLDTSRIELKFIEKDSLFSNPSNRLAIVNQPSTGKGRLETSEIGNIQDLFKPVKINFSRPIATINNFKSIQFREDSTQKSTETKFSLDPKTKQFITLDFNKKENTSYSVTIPDSAFQDLFGIWNKSLIYKFRTNSKDGYGNLRITLKTNHPENYYVIRLMNSNNEMLKEFFLSGNDEKKASVENIPAGAYRFLVIDDKNKNGVWDTGNFKEKIQPEKMFMYKDTYQLKGGWDLEAEVKF